MPQEIELKLRLPPAAAEALAAHPALAGRPAATRRLVNTYYDTPELALHRAAIALRFRRRGAEWLLTVKGAVPGAGGLASRSEWEAPRRKGDFDFSHVDDAALRARLEDCRARLIPLFTTDFTRRSWLLPVAAGGGIEVACDLGTIRAGRRSAPLCELELERCDGSDSAPLFALAIALASELPLHPEAASKAERGYALAAATPPSPRKTAPTPVTAAMSPVEAFRAIAFDCLDQLLRNEPGAIDGADPEYVHQARVGIRRLRSAFSLFAPVLPDGFRDTWGGPWREVANALGEGRDWDVLMHETLPRFRDAHPDYRPPRALERAAAKAHEAALATTRTALSHRGYSVFLLHFSAALHALEAGDAPIVASGPLAPFARARLDRLLKRVNKIVATTRLKTHLHRHALRIALKKLRYATDFFAPLLPEKALAAYRKRLAALQDVLGRLNDIVVGRELLATLKRHRGPDPLDNWLAGEHGRELRRLAGALRRLERAERPWRR